MVIGLDAARRNITFKPRENGQAVRPHISKVAYMPQYSLLNFASSIVSTTPAINGSVYECRSYSNGAFDSSFDHSQ